MAKFETNPNVLNSNDQNKKCFEHFPPKADQPLAENIRISSLTSINILSGKRCIDIQEVMSYKNNTIKGLKILGIIPARADSKGLKGKNIKILGRKPLIEYTFSVARESHTLSRIVLTTDSSRIARLGRRAGIEVPFLRPRYLAQDYSSASTYIKHCLNYLKRAGGYTPDIIVILQPTAPFRLAKDIDACVSMLIESGADSVVSVTRVPSTYHALWQLVLAVKGRLSLFNRKPLRSIVSCRQKLSPTYIRNGAVYAFWSEVFFKTHSIYGNKVLGYLMPDERSVNIDNKEDWRKAEELLKRLNKR